MVPKTEPKPRQNRNDPPDSPPSDGRPDALPDDLRRRDQPATPPDSLPPERDIPSLAVDGGNPNHPVHDDDVEDLDSGDFEEEVDALEAPNDDPAFDRADEIAPLLDPKR